MAAFVLAQIPRAARRRTNSSLPNSTTGLLAASCSSMSGRVPARSWEAPDFRPGSSHLVDCNTMLQSKWPKTATNPKGSGRPKGSQKRTPRPRPPRKDDRHAPAGVIVNQCNQGGSRHDIPHNIPHNRQGRRCTSAPRTIEPRPRSPRGHASASSAAGTRASVTLC
jgi:hypothetical protein